MHVRLINFLDSKNSLYDRHYGFRPGRSWEYALLSAQDTLLKSLNNRQVFILLLLDFSQAFDTVNHTILFSKLAHYGVRGPALNLKWLRSTLGHRKQCVSVIIHERYYLWSTSRIYTRSFALHNLYQRYSWNIISWKNHTISIRRRH